MRSRVGMSITSLVVIVLIVVGRSAVTSPGNGERADGMPPVHVLQSVPSEPVSLEELSALERTECRNVPVPKATSATPIGAAIELLEASRAADQRCGAPVAAVAVCRGLWAAWVLDPVVVANTRPEHAARAADTAGWAIESAALSATHDEKLASALRKLARVNQQLVETDLSDAEIFALLEDRISSDVINPLAVAERRCNADGYEPD